METTKSSTRGWLSLICVVAANLIFSGFIAAQVGLLIEPISTDLGLPRTVYTSIESVTPIANAVLSMFFVLVYNKLGLKKMIMIGSVGAILYCVCTLLASSMRGVAIPLFVLGQIFLGVTMSWATTMTIAITINAWFAKNRGLLVSIVSASGAVGGTIASPLVAKWIATSGWESTMIFRGVAAAVVLILFFVLYKERPGANESMVWKGEEDAQEETASGEEYGLTLAQARKTKNFWAGLFVCLGVGLFAYPPFIVFAAFCIDCGLPEIQGPAMSVIFIASIIVTLPMGALIEKYGVKKVIVPIYVALAAALVAFTIVQSKAMLYIGAIAIGAGYATAYAFIPMLTSSVFGTRDFASIQSKFFAMMIIGMVIGPPIFNAVFDATGSYNGIFIADAIACVVDIIVLFIATKKLNFSAFSA